MLVLSRRPSEKIVFPGTGITVHVIGFRGNAVKIGVDAPPEIQVLRAELAAGDTTPARQASNGSSAGRLQRAGTLLRQLIDQRDQGLGSAAVEEILAEMRGVLEVPEPNAAPRQTRLSHGPSAGVPDFLAERAGFKGILKKDE